MALEKPKKVQAYIRLMHQCHPESRAYFEELIQVIELILHYETRDEIILANLINSIQRRGKSPKSNQDEYFFAALLRLFNKLIRAPGRHAEVAKSFKAEMSRYKEDKLFYLFTYIKLDCWLEAIIKKRSFAEQIKKAWHQRHQACFWFLCLFVWNLSEMIYLTPSDSTNLK